MKIRFALSALGAFALLFVAGTAAASPAYSPIGTSFTYQGRLTDGSLPANGSYDFQFKLYDADAGGSQVGSTLTKDDTTVTDGVFTVELDFGSAFDGTGLYLEVGVRAGSGTGSDPYTTLTPRQELTATPYALYAASAPWSGLTGVPRSDHSHWGASWTGIGTGLSLSGGSTGLSASGSLDGVYGSSGGTGDGVHGQSVNGTGVYGVSTNNQGVYGSGSVDGVYGYTGGAGDGVNGVSSSGRGVYGYSSSGNGVEGSSGSAFGVKGSGTIGVHGTGVTGVYGYGGPGVQGQASSPGAAAVQGIAAGLSGDFAGLFVGNVYVEGNFTLAPGYTKSGSAETADYGIRKLYAVESPENWFEDFGSADLVSGEAVVTIEPIFAQTVNLTDEYFVFLTPRGDCALYVAEETPTSFTVRTVGGRLCEIPFQYRIVAKRLGFEDVRLTQMDAVPPTTPTGESTR